jgi:hypothetical protein
MTQIVTTDESIEIAISLSTQVGAWSNRWARRSARLMLLHRDADQIALEALLIGN